MKKCPYCFNEIQDMAVKCKFCKKFLDSTKETTTQIAETSRLNKYIQCKNCKHDNDVNNFYCGNCGASLVDKSRISFKNISDKGEIVLKPATVEKEINDYNEQFKIIKDEVVKKVYSPIKICPKCNKSYDGTWKVCLHCNAALIETNPLTAENVNNKNKGIPETHPWVRYWAKYVDLVLFSSTFAIFLAITAPEVLKIPEIGFAILAICAWTFVEPIFLSTWGTTPGKWILKTSLRHLNGQKPSYYNALKRSLHILVRGFGLGIPLVSFITQIESYHKLVNNGITEWDRAGEFNILHKKFGALRILVVIGILSLYIVLIAIGKST